MKYIFFDVEKLVEDEEFIQWVKYPNPERDFFWNSFLAEYPEKRETVFEAKAIVESFAENEVVMPKDEVARLRSVLISNLNVSSVVSDNPNPSTNPFFSVYFKIAATLLILLVSSFAVYFLVTKKGGTEVAIIEKVSTYGQRSSLILPDGSKVWLNGGSRIKYRNGLENNGLREVFLEGEAFFEVAKNKKKPFIVNTHGIKIKVLGTKFNVKSYQSDPTIETTLVEGSVSINESKENIVLKPNEKAIFSKKKMNLELISVNPERDYAWKDGFLMVENESFGETIDKLERWYGVDLELIGGENCKMNFKISGETLIDVLENMKDALKITYKKVDNRFVIQAINCE
jgi:transmembrane sensor